MDQYCISVYSSHQQFAWFPYTFYKSPSQSTALNLKTHFLSNNYKLDPHLWGKVSHIQGPCCSQHVLKFYAFYFHRSSCQGNNGCTYNFRSIQCDEWHSACVCGAEVLRLQRVNVALSFWHAIIVLLPAGHVVMAGMKQLTGLICSNKFTLCTSQLSSKCLVHYFHIKIACLFLIYGFGWVWFLQF